LSYIIFLKLKKALLSFLIFIFCSLSNAQSWQPVGNGFNGYVNTLFVYDSVMYAGGAFTSPGNNIAQWNGSYWDGLGSGISNQVYAIGSYKGLIYIGGWFSEAGGHSAGSITTWNGKAFANAGFDVEGGKVATVQAYDSLLYIGGQFDSVNTNFNCPGLISWNGSKIDSVGGSNYWKDVSILTIYNDLLILGFSPAVDGQPIITRNAVSGAILGNVYFSQATSSLGLNFNAFCKVDSNLYIGGQFLSLVSTYPPYSVIDTVNNIVMWNDSEWVNLGTGINGMVYALVSYKNLIIAGGSFDSAGGVPVNNIAAWNGSSWSAIGNGVNGPVYALAVFDSNLYAGGDFSSPGAGIAEYTVSLKNRISDSINVFPNPNNGQFTVVCNSKIVASSQATIEIYNILGEKIYSANLMDGNTNINLGKQAAGIYIYRISTSEGNLINPGKLMIDNAF
jgi:trimeric autotransporter adhesin